VEGDWSNKKGEGKRKGDKKKRKRYGKKGIAVTSVLQLPATLVAAAVAEGKKGAEIAWVRENMVCQGKRGCERSMKELGLEVRLSVAGDEGKVVTQQHQGNCSMAATGSRSGGTFKPLKNSKLAAATDGLTISYASLRE
jgi:hypothetical protein